MATSTTFSKVPCPRRGCSPSEVRIYDDGSILCYECSTSWVSQKDYEADVIARKLVDRGPNEWLQNDLPKELIRLVKTSKADMVRELWNLAEQVIDSQSTLPPSEQINGVELARNIADWANQKIEELESEAE